MKVLFFFFASFVLAIPCQVRGQDGSLQLTLALDTAQSQSTGSQSITFITEFRNTLAVPLRWHPPAWVYAPIGKIGQEQPGVCLERSDGTRYLATGQKGNGPLIAPFQMQPDDSTTVYAPGASGNVAGEIGAVIKCDTNFVPIMDEAELAPLFHGPLPAGEYDVWVQILDGPEGERFQDRMPQFGLYKSNRVHLTVLSDGQAAAPGKKLRLAAKDADSLLSLRGCIYANSKGLAGYGIQTRVQAGGKVSMTKGQKSIDLVLGNKPLVGAGNTSTLRAVVLTGSKHFLIPLEPAVKHLGLKLKADKKGKVYDLVALR
jgi:hypothetical protein